MQWLHLTYAGNTVAGWLSAAGIAAATLAILLVARRVATKRLAAFARTTETALDDLVAELLTATRTAFLAVIAAFAGSLALAGRLPEVLGRAAALALILQGALWAERAIAFIIADYGRRNAAGDPGAVMTVRALGFLSRIALWSLVVILALGNLGVNVTALVAGLGVGGIAVALAVQNILGDLFASLSIVIDKPFVQGDFIIVGDFMGVVDHVGLKTTRVRSLGGEQIIFSNADLLQSRIRNYTRMAERRVVFGVAVTYDTPLEKVRAIPGLLREVVEARRPVRFDRAHLKAFGAYALDFEVVYYVTDPDYNLYMDIQQAIQFEILRRFEAEGIAFAYPTRTIRLERSAAGKEAAGAGLA
jgi:small-conductance mechanosensitive channel